MEKGALDAEEPLHGGADHGCALKEHAAGEGTGELCRRLGISQETWYRWRRKYGGMEVREARRLRALQEENRRLKRLVADRCWTTRY